MNDKALQELLAQQSGLAAPPESQFDFTVDEAIRKSGTLPPERRAVKQIRALVEATIEGADPAELEKKLDAVGDNLEKAVAACREQADKQPDKREYFLESVHAYVDVLDAIDKMLSALDSKNGEFLIQTLASFEAAVAEVDALAAMAED